VRAGILTKRNADRQADRHTHLYGQAVGRRYGRL